MSPRNTHYGTVVEGLLNLAAYLSLVGLVAGFLTRVPVWMVLGCAFGVVGMVCGFVSLGRRLSNATAICVGLVIVALDLSMLVAMWFTT